MKYEAFFFLNNFVLFSVLDNKIYYTFMEIWWTWMMN